MSESVADIAINIICLVETAPGAGQPDDVTGWFEIMEVFDQSPPDEQADDVEVTHYRSPNRRKEYKQGLTDPGSTTFSMNYIPGSLTDLFLIAWKNTGENRKVRVIYDDYNLRITYSAYAKGYKPATPIGDKMTADLELKVSGSTVQDAAA